MVMSMKAKNIIIMALAGILLTACKDKTYKTPTLDAMRSADKARAAWARETEEHPATVETQTSGMGIDIAKVTLLSWKPLCLAGKV